MRGEIVYSYIHTNIHLYKSIYTPRNPVTKCIHKHVYQILKLGIVRWKRVVVLFAFFSKKKNIYTYAKIKFKLKFIMRNTFDIATSIVTISFSSFTFPRIKRFFFNSFYLVRSFEYSLGAEQAKEGKWKFYFFNYTICSGHLNIFFYVAFN